MRAFGVHLILNNKKDFHKPKAKAQAKVKAQAQAKAQSQAHKKHKIVCREHKARLASQAQLAMFREHV